MSQKEKDPIEFQNSRYDQERRAAIARIEKIADPTKPLSLNQAAALLPENPEWERLFKTGR